jgi:hypothetical protein
MEPIVTGRSWYLRRAIESLGFGTNWPGLFLFRPSGLVHFSNCVAFGVNARALPCLY